ncbi:915_t:CDS:2, partial [Cetraspora pellucida]
KNNIFQLINYSNENDEMHIDDNDFSSIKLETATKNNKKYLIKSVDSFYETEKSEEEINKSKIANKFKLNEITLAMHYVPYPHDSKTIAIVLEEIINDWKLNNKFQKALDIMLATLDAKSDYNSKTDTKQLHAIILTKNEWQILKQLTNLLAPFAEATTLLGGSTYFTLSFMLSAIKVLLQNCKPKANDYKDYQIKSEFDNNK